jgi:hypothetical protein
MIDWKLSLHRMLRVSATISAKRMFANVDNALRGADMGSPLVVVTVVVVEVRAVVVGVGDDDVFCSESALAGAESAPSSIFSSSISLSSGNKKST